MRKNITSDHAIVIGASIAGLLSARVLADRFACVTVIDRDVLPQAPERRTCVPQGGHAHGLLARGLEILVELFPGMREEMIAGGAIHDDISVLAFHQFGVWKTPDHVGIPGMFASRPYLEWHIRRRVAALPNVHIVDHRSVTGFLMSADGQRVVGVEVADETVPADLVVDASGRGSHSPAFLEAVSYARPPEEKIEVDLAYATRLYKRGPFSGWKAMLVSPTPPHGRRMGVLFPLEGDRWILTLAGWLGDHAPTDEAGFMAFAKSLPVPDVHDTVRACEPLSSIGFHKFPSSLRRRYEKCDMPAGLVVVGDAVCSFNPAYGQGMTTSALEAIAMRSWLAAHAGAPAEATRSLQKEIGRIVDRAWMVSAGEDFRYPETVGVRAPGTDLVNAYIGAIHRASGHDPKVTHAFYRVMHMFERPEALFHPATALRVLRSVLFPGRSAVRTSPILEV